MGARPWFPGWRKGAGHVFSMANVVLHPQSRGEVTLRSTNPKDAPRILFNLLQAPEDRATFRAMLRFVRKFFATAPASSLVSEERLPGAAVQSDDEIDAWVRSMVGTAMHPTSTCAMGIDANAVVDAELRVRGLDALRVVDASVMPRIPGGNTNAPVIMIAEKASDLILGKRLPAADISASTSAHAPMHFSTKATSRRIVADPSSRHAAGCGYQLPPRRWHGRDLRFSRIRRA